MSDTPSSGGADEPVAGAGPSGVLRPFEPTEIEPLPPIEPPRVEPEPVATVDELAPIEALADEPFAIDASDLDEPWSPSPIDAPVVPAPPANPITADDLTDPLLRPSVDDDPDVPGDTPVAGVLPDAAPATDTITVSRRLLFGGIGVVGLVLLVLVALWQTAGDDAPVALAPADEPGEPSVAPVEVEDVAPVDGAPGVIAAQLADAETRLTDAEAQLADAEATVASLRAEVETLQGRPPPALSGDAMRRIVVGADANFISAGDNNIAVVGGFGGLTMIDPASNQVIASRTVGDAANRVLRTQSSVWITNYQDNLIVQVDPGTNTVKALFPFPGPDGIEKVGDTLAVASFDENAVVKIDPGTGEAIRRVDVGGSPTDLHFGHGGLWVAVFDTGELVRLDPDSFEIRDRILVGAGPVGIGADATHLWVTNNGEGTVAKVDPETAEVVFTVEVGEGPAEVVSVEGSAWVTVSDDGNLVQIDANDGTIVSVTPLGGAIAGGGPTGIDYAAGALWIAMQGEQSVVRINL